MPVLPTAPPEHPTQKSALTDLSVIGVPDEFQKGWPQVVAYPSKFSDEAFPIWDSLLSDAKFVERARSSGSKDVAWHLAILEFLGRCHAQDVLVMDGVSSSGPTTHVRDQIRRGRIFLVDYANEIKLFEKVQVRYAYREYIRTAKGITVYSWARMFPYLDPTFEKYLVSLPMPRFIKHQRNRMVAQIRPNVRLWVNCINLYRIEVGQEIDVDGSIDVPGNQTPTREEVDAFLDSHIWMPLVRSIRFDHIENRLF